MSHRFCRAALAETMKEVYEHTSAEQRKAAWVYIYHWTNRMADFHGPEGFHWRGPACCRWQARALGWAAWLHKEGKA